MRVIQINLQHCKAASAILTDKFQKNHFDIALVQEPWIRENKVKGLVGGGEVVHQSNFSHIKTRTCIFIKPTLKKVFLPDLSNGDLTSIKLYIVEKNGFERQVVICSAYFPCPPLNFPGSSGHLITKVTDYCRSHNLQLIVGCDANAHHLAWGSSNTNTRGVDVMDFITLTNLEVVNVGNEPTFSTVNRREVLDLTLASTFISSKISKWKVLDEPSGSDHRLIYFEISTLIPEVEKFRNRRKTDWTLYSEKLSHNLRNVEIKNCYETQSEFNKAADKLRNAVINSFEASCPLVTKRSKSKNPWFTS